MLTCRRHDGGDGVCGRWCDGRQGRCSRAVDPTVAMDNKRRRAHPAEKLCDPAFPADSASIRSMDSYMYIMYTTHKKMNMHCG